MCGVYALLHCELAEGHDPPHMAVARGYSRAMRWVRDDRGLAHALPEPATGTPVIASITHPPPAPEGEVPEVPLTGGDRLVPNAPRHSLRGACGGAHPASSVVTLRGAGCWFRSACVPALVEMQVQDPDQPGNLEGHDPVQQHRADGLW